MKNWQDRLRESLGAPVAQRKRFLFQELNPGQDYSPILESPPSKMRPAAVMIGVRNIEEPTIVLTLRSPTMPSHAGQISFPGGTPKKDDDGLVDTAIRETAEEVGVDRGALDVLGSLGKHVGGLGYIVTPVLALLEPDTTIDACPREVAEAFEVPLRCVLNPQNHIVQQHQFNGKAYDMFAVPVSDTTGRHRNIWGLTAGILRTLSDAYRDA